MPDNPASEKQLLVELENLRARLKEAEETLRAIRGGEVDAIVIPGAAGKQLFTLKGADYAYRVLVEEMNEGALTVTAEGLILYANRHYAGMLKAPLEKVIGSVIHTLVAPESREAFQSLLQKGSNEKHREQLYFTAKDGSLVPVFLSVSNPIVNDMQVLFCMVVTDLTEQKRSDEIAASEKLARELLKNAEQSRRALLSVIEDQKQAEEALTASKIYLDRIINAVASPIFVKDDKHRFVLVNEALCSLLDFPPEKLIGGTGLKHFPQEQQDVFIAKDQEVLKSGNENISEEYITDGNGVIRTVITRKSLYVDNAGKKYLVGVINDITARKLAEDALRNNQVRLRTLLQTLPDLIWLKDTEGVYLLCNTMFERFFGAKEADIIGKTDYDFVDRELADFFRDHDRKAMNADKPTSNEEWVTFADDGHRALLDTIKMPMYDSNKALIGVLGVGRDITYRDIAEAGVRASEVRYRRLFESAKDGILILDAETGIIVDANPYLINLMEFPQEYYFGKYIWELGFFKDIVSNREHFLKLKETGYVRYEDMPLKTASGSSINVEFVSNAYFVNDKKVIQCNIRNITERKKAEDALRESRELLQTVLNSIPVRVFWKDNNLVYLGCNTSLAQDAGFEKPEDLIGRDDYVMGWREQAEIYRADDRAVIESGEGRFLFEEPQTTPSGERIHLLTSKVPLRNSSGEIVGVLGTYYDITGRKRAEEALKLFRMLIDQSNDAIEVIDPATGRFLDVNERACLDLGYSRNELLSLTVCDIDPSVDSSVFVNGQEGFQKSGVMIVEGIHRRKDGSIFPVEANLKYIKLDRDYLVSITRDITERKKSEVQKEKLQAQLLQAQKIESVGRLAGGIAHDFNNLLSVIIGHSELALEKADPKSELYSDVMEIKGAADRSAELTKQLLGFARKQTVAPITLDLNRSVGRIINMLKPLMGEDITLKWHASENLWPIFMDPSQLDQLLINLCVNSRDAIEGDGKIVIETENAIIDETYCGDHPYFRPGKFVMIAVSDSGCGMDKETAAQIFEPFFTTKEQGKGTGLGLSTVFGIVKQNFGFINVYSEPGKGTTFKIYIPRYGGSEAARPLSVPDKKPFHGNLETILLVEDEGAILKVAAKILQNLGYDVFSANSPEEALRIASDPEKSIDLLITDIIMPEMNGKELFETLKELRPSLKVLFMSGYTADVIAHHGILDKDLHFLPKPFTTMILARKVKEALE